MRNKLFLKSKQTVYDACLTALGKLNCKMVSKDFNDGLIKAEKGMGLLSYGHVLSISIQSKESQKTEVRVTSKSIGIQIIDWGTNSGNEEEIIKLIISIIK